MPQAVGDRIGHIGVAVGTVFRLKEKVTKREAFERGGIYVGLGEDELQFVSRRLDQLGRSLRADRDPVDR